MKTVNVLKSWSYPNLLEQTPSSKGIWKDIEFRFNSVQPSDYVVILNNPEKDTTVTCPPDHVWAIMQEPPTEFFEKKHRGDPSYARIYTSDVKLTGPKYFHSHPALPWHINRPYDFLKSLGAPAKAREISWITSSLTSLKGHRDRLAFLATMREKIEFDLFGRGFYPVDDKWLAIAPYQYSLAIENFSNPFYWSEKIADCFLAWTMPIYYGCTRITEYFPAESMVMINIHNPKEALDQIQEAVRTQRWRKNLDAIYFAREQVLEHYQFFPFISEQIQQNSSFVASKAQVIWIPSEPRIPLTTFENIQNTAEKIFPAWLFGFLIRIYKGFKKYL